MSTKNNLIAWFRTTTSEADFEETYRVELPRIYNYFCYRVGDAKAAEDLTSETFEKAWRNRWRYRRDLAVFSTWLFTIASRVLQDYYRKKRDDLPLEQVTEPGMSENLEDLIEQNADFAQLSVLFSRLADREREY